MRPAVFVAALLAGITLFFVGVHNSDNSWNMLRLEAATGVTFVDRSIAGTQYDAEQLFGLGVHLTFIGFIVTVTSAALLVENHYKPIVIESGRKRDAHG